jgi:hypothetical protein
MDEEKLNKETAVSNCKDIYFKETMKRLRYYNNDNDKLDAIDLFEKWSEE